MFNRLASSNIETTLSSATTSHYRNNGLTICDGRRDDVLGSGRAMYVHVKMITRIQLMPIQDMLFQGEGEAFNVRLWMPLRRDQHI